MPKTADDIKQDIRHEYNELRDVFGRHKTIMELRKTFKKLTYSEIAKIVDNKEYPLDCFDPRRDMQGIMIRPYFDKVSPKKAR